MTRTSSQSAMGGMTLTFLCPAALGIVLVAGGVGWTLRQRRWRER